MTFRVFVQARMSSERFPGKMLAPFRGRPLIASLLDRLGPDLLPRTVLLTSDHATDDPLADFVERRCAVPVFRGELQNVAARFQACLAAYPCEWFVRLSGDSPLMSGPLVTAMLGFTGPGHDVVSNVVKRTFPPGQSVECIRSDVFAALKADALTAAQQEHVTKIFYDGQGNWRLRSIVCREPGLSGTRMVVDSLDDLRALEALATDPSASLAALVDIEA